MTVRQGSKGMMWPTRPASIGGEQPMLKNPKILQREYCNYVSAPSERKPLRVARIGALASIQGLGLRPRTREEEPDSGVLRTGVPTGSKAEGCLRGTQANQSLYNLPGN